MITNKIQFAVVREDPDIEIDLISKFGANKVLIIGSGGCTALSVKTVFPEIDISLIDPNSDQINLVKKKIRILKKNKLLKARKIIGTTFDNPVIESGNFESLFKMFREFIFEFVITKSELMHIFKSKKAAKWKPVFNNRYWSTAFTLYFSDALLTTMFGPEAVQYAPKGSYPDYFKKNIEKGLLRSDVISNYFLHHIFLGHYIADTKCLPLYLTKCPVNLSMKFNECMANEFQDYNDFDLISLSNIFDWSSPEQVDKISKKVSSYMKKGSILIYRQLNNSTNFKKLFKGYKWFIQLEKSFLEKDRSLFYSKICVGRKL